MLLTVAAAAANAGDASMRTESNRIFILLETPADFDSAAMEINKIGVAGSIFLPRVLEAYVPAENRRLLKQIKSIMAYFEGEIAYGDIPGISVNEKQLVGIWNLEKSGNIARTPPGFEELGPSKNDARIPPDYKLAQEARKRYLKAAASGRQSAPDVYDTTGFMLGKCFVKHIFIESDGTTEPNTRDWTDLMKTQKESRMKKDLGSWEFYAPAGRLQFVYDDPVSYTINVGIEPANTADDAQPQAEAVILAAILKQFNADTPDNDLQDIRKYIHAERKRVKADWAYMVISFTKWWSYAYMGGPITMEGGAILHETGHIYGYYIEGDDPGDYMYQPRHAGTDSASVIPLMMSPKTYSENTAAVMRSRMEH